MKKILLLLLLILIVKININATTYSISESASGFIYIGTKGDLSDFVDEDGNSLPSWTGGYNIRIQSGKNVYIGNNSFDPDVVIDTLFLDGTINNTAYRTTTHFGTIIVSGTGNFNADNHSGGRLYVNVQDIVLEEGAEFSVPSVGSSSYSGLNWSGSISVEDNVTINTGGASNNLITLSQINSLPGNNPKTVAQGTLDAIPSNINSVVLNGNTAITTDLSSSDVNIYTEGNDLVIANTINSDVTIFADLTTNTNPSVDLSFAGTASGTVTLAPTNNRVRSVTMNTTSTVGVTLGYKIDVVNSSYNFAALTLLNGKLITSETNVLTLDEFSYVANAVYSWSGHASGGSSNSYIEGPLAKEIDYNATLKAAFSISGNDFFLMFPVGKNGTLREAGLGIPTADTKTTFRVEYFNSAHPNNRNIDPSSTVDVVSEFEYWNVDRISGAAGAAVTLTYDTNSGLQNAHILDAQVMHYNGSLWEDQGNQSQHTVGDDAGTLMSGLASSFSPFTLGGSNNHDLPVELTYFEGEKNTDGSISLYWETASEVNNSHFEVQGSRDGRNFEILGQVEGNGNSNLSIEYAFDVSQERTANYRWYRLRQVDFDGAYEYSETIQVISDQITIQELNIYPIPAQGMIHTKIISSDEVEISSAYILNAYGMMVKEIDTHHLEDINIANLLDGVYFLSVTTAKGTKDVKRFIVRN
ncbi:T9SS type A sorting domain-containing protein [Flammeovirga aprica]|uniref:T9SS type A sorting domain-containing protein n=1 Tax=Flammeovirga aprica JL-4 TaxID=694437 RepID=A0A7X9RV35_9BACT|nr:T9SS type A sorting domain-containing protein [Flammeovirga aprica]NME69247.1 T9SS type A sorting domain-containing protein [Flammeovirga aprica JL-4]